MSVGRPAAEDGHAAGVVQYSLGSVALIGYVFFEIVFSLNIAVKLPFIVFSAESLRVLMEVQSKKTQRKRDRVDLAVPHNEDVCDRNGVLCTLCTQVHAPALPSRV